MEVIYKNVKRLLEPYKLLQVKLITELSIIRGNEGFKNEEELLIALEKFKWGLETSEYVESQIPKNIPVYDMSVLNRGLHTPPHIQVSGFIMSVVTKSFARRKFEELVIRLLRQVEIKLSSNNSPDTNTFSQQLLIQVFDNFHSFCNQLKNRHNQRGTIEIKDAYDVQDLLHAILRLHFKDVREEEYTPSYAGSSTRMDFLLKNESIVIEVKKTRDKL